jgi:enamine deaminase RidA (YjgF/YER057c/UK114 family)
MAFHKVVTPANAGVQGICRRYHDEKAHQLRINLRRTEMMISAGLADPRMKIEIEVTACKGL